MHNEHNSLTYMYKKDILILILYYDLNIFD